MVYFNISFRDMSPSESVSSLVQDRIERLERINNNMISCEVVVSLPHKHRVRGRIPHIHLRLKVPGKTLVVDRDPEKDESHQDIHIVVGDAFAALERKLEDYTRLQHRVVKTLSAQPDAVVSRLFPDDDYGFIEDQDGRELYFHRNSVLNGGFEKLEVGAHVRFSEEMGEKGPQVTSMHIVGREL